MVQIALRTALIGCACLLAGCSLIVIQPPDSPAAVQTLPPGVDQAGTPLVSPDGKKLAWHVFADDGVTTLVRDKESGDTVAYTLGRNFPYWASDSRHLIVEKDLGLGSTQILVVDTAQPKELPLNITPWKGAKSFVLHVGKPCADRITFISNRRSELAFDVYEADIRTGRTKLLFRNNGDVVQWVMDEDGTVGARVRRQDQFYILQVLSKTTDTWKSVYKWQQTDAVLPVRIERDAGKALLVTHAAPEKQEMIELKLADLGTKD